MAVTWNLTQQQVAHLLGNILGTSVAQAETNYTATMTNSTLKGPDYVESVIQDALAATLVEIVELVAATPFHPERSRYADTVAAVTSGSLLAATAAGGARILGVPGRIIDASDSVALRPAKSLDDVISFNRFKSAGSIYNGKNEYLFAWDDKALYHTRTTVTVSVVAFDRPTTFNGNITMGDQFENMIIWGAVRRLAPKEGMYQRLYEDAAKEWDAGAAKIAMHGNAPLWGDAQGAPATA